VSLRNDRLAKGKPSEHAAAPAASSDFADTPPSDADLRCIGLHHHPEPIQAEAMPARQTLKVTARAPVVGRLPSREDKLHRAENNSVNARHISSREIKTTNKTGPRAAESSRLPLHTKGAGRPFPRHALHAMPRNAGTA
jgi:hypothetical protein